MLFNRLNLEVAKFASKSDVKSVIAGVLFKKDKVVATDSFRLLEVSTDKGLDVAEYPRVGKVSAMRGFKPFIVEAKAVKDIKIPRAASLPIAESVAVKHISNDAVEFLTTDLGSTDIKRARRVEGQFPDYEAIIPQGKPVVEVELNGEYLAELLQVMSKLDKVKKVKVKLYGGEKPIVLEAGNTTQTARGLLMPIRS